MQSIAMIEPQYYFWAAGFLTTKQWDDFHRYHLDQGQVVGLKILGKSATHWMLFDQDKKKLLENREEDNEHWVTMKIENIWMKNKQVPY